MHKLGGKTGCGYDIRPDGAIVLASANDNPFENVNTEMQAIRSLTQSIVDHAYAREKECLMRLNKWWKDMAEDVGFSLDGWTYDSTTRTLHPPKGTHTKPKE